MKCAECGGEDIVCTQCGKRQHNDWTWMEDMNGKMILARLPYRVTIPPIDTSKYTFIQKVRVLLKRYHRQPEE